MTEFDPGPPEAIAQHFAALPSVAAHRDLYWYDWGPVFYRGRLDGSARLLGIASDPGPTERIACRTLVGDAGQRVQGFLAKLGLRRSYVLVNAHAYAVHPGKADQATPVLAEEEQRDWRNALYDLVVGPELQAVVAFGAQAREALRLWDPPADIPTFKVPHPSSHDETALVNEWREAIVDLRAVVTADPDGDASLPNYGGSFDESDYARIPPRDLPFGLPAWFGDDSWVRSSEPVGHNSVRRSRQDPEHTLEWGSPENQP